MTISPCFIGLILPLVCAQVAVTTGLELEPCLHSTCTCESARLVCNPYLLEGDQWVEMQEVPNIIRYITLPRLQEMDFRYNKIQHLGSDAFHGLHNLNNLWLSHNHILNISTTAFNNLAALQMVDLSYNRVRKIKTGSFTSLPPMDQLHIIDLSNNDIIHLEQGCFNAVSNLKQLYLHHNPLSELDRYSFTDLSVMNTLSLAHSFPREADDLMNIVRPLTRLRLLFIAGVVRNCSCDWPVAVETLEARKVDVMDEPDAVGHCVEIWKLDCDQNNRNWTRNFIRHGFRIHNVTEVENQSWPLNFTQQATRPIGFSVKEVRIRNLTMDDIVPPVARGNDTIVFPDGSEYDMYTIEGKRALYKYDRAVHEQITQIWDDKERGLFNRTFQERMVLFIRTHYVLNSNLHPADQNMTSKKSQEYGNQTHNPLSSSEKLRNSTMNTSLSTSSKKSKGKLREGMPLTYLWLIVAGVACSLVVMGLVSLKHIDCKEHGLQEPVRESKRNSPQKRGLFGKVTGKLNIRKQHMTGTAERKHAKQTFAKNSFVVMHNRAKDNIDMIQEQRRGSENVDYNTSPSNHIIPPRPLHQSGQNWTTSSGSQRTSNQGPPVPPPVPPLGLRRSSLNDGIRKMVASQRLSVTGGNPTPSEESAYLANFYTDSDYDDDDGTDADAETDLFRR